MKLDDGRMEGMLEKYVDAPCIGCKHRTSEFNSFELNCPFFKNGSIPNDIVNGENMHTDKHPKQIMDGLFSERDWKLDM